MERAPAYHPSLFSKQAEQDAPSKKSAPIPQKTLYDMPLQPQTTPRSRHVTVFGFSPSNREEVLNLIRKTVEIERKEEGRNYISVWTEDPTELNKLMKFNHTTVNGEIIGVFQKNFGLVRDEDIYVKKKGLFQIISEYLFGR